MDGTKVSFESKTHCDLNGLHTENPTVVFNSLSTICWKFITLRGISKGIPVLHRNMQ